MTSNRLAVLAAEIRTAHADTLRHVRSAIEQAIAVGNLLTEAKDLIGHGDWLPWLKDHCAMSTRTAQRYMTLARSEANTPRVALLGIRAAEEAIAKHKGRPEPEAYDWGIAAGRRARRPPGQTT
jgi:hypothetical protein